MTPALLKKSTIIDKRGATVVGAPPIQSPGLSNFPQCDDEVQSIAKLIWEIQNHLPHKHHTLMAKEK